MDKRIVKFNLNLSLLDAASTVHYLELGRLDFKFEIEVKLKCNLSIGILVLQHLEKIQAFIHLAFEVGIELASPTGK